MFAVAAKCGEDKDVIISRFTDDDSCKDIKTVKFEIENGADVYEVFVLDDERTLNV